MLYKGVVQKGNKRGSVLGYPTINIPLSDTDISGVYAARVRIENKQFIAAAFADQKRNVLEAYMLDFSADVYEKEVTIELYEKIRESEQFVDDETLKAAIEDDVRRVREYFAKKV